MTILPNFEHVRSFAEPFRHAWIPLLFPADTTDRLLCWLEQDRPWEYTETDFYRQFEFSLDDAALPAELDFATAGGTLRRMGEWLSGEFGGSDVMPVDVVAHLLEEGHDIGIHNDHVPGGETHRLLLQLGREGEGGVTALLRGSSVSSVQRLIHPIHGTALAFRITEDSYHAVSRVRSGRRFTIVYSFRAGG